MRRRVVPALLAALSLFLSSCDVALSSPVGALRRRTAQVVAPVDLLGWTSLYDATNGSAWVECAELRDSPCECAADPLRFVECACKGSECRITKVVLRSNNLVTDLLPVAEMRRLDALQELRLDNVEGAGLDVSDNLFTGYGEDFGLVPCVDLRKCDECSFPDAIVACDREKPTKPVPGPPIPALAPPGPSKIVNSSVVEKVGENSSCVLSSSTSVAGTFVELNNDVMVLETASEEDPFIMVDLGGLFYLDRISFGTILEAEASNLTIWCSDSSHMDMSLPFAENHSWQKTILVDAKNFSVHVHTPCSIVGFKRESFGKLTIANLYIYGSKIRDREVMDCFMGDELCSSNGECVDSYCKCFYGYSGMHCEDFLLGGLFFSTLQASIAVSLLVGCILLCRNARSDRLLDFGTAEFADARAFESDENSLKMKRWQEPEREVGDTKGGSFSSWPLCPVRSTSQFEDEDSAVRFEEGGVHFLFASPLIMTSLREDVPQFRPIQGLDIKREYLQLRRSLRDSAVASCKSARAEVPVAVSCATIERFHSLLTLGNARCIHFSGHCTNNFIALEDAASQLHALDMKGLRSLLKSTLTPSSVKTLRLVLLNACSSEAAGREFAAAGIAHVVVLRRRVSDVLAATFTQAFYLALGCARPVHEAFASAKEAVRVSPSFLKEEGDAFLLLPEREPHDEVIWQTEGVIEREPSQRWPQVHNMTPLPPICEDFLGRNACIYRVLRSIIPERRRLVAIHACTPGIGRSQLLLALSRHILERRSTQLMRDGVFFVKARWCKRRRIKTEADLLAALVDAVWESMFSLLTDDSMTRGPIEDRPVDDVANVADDFHSEDEFDFSAQMRGAVELEQIKGIGFLMHSSDEELSSDDDVKCEQEVLLEKKARKEAAALRRRAESKTCLLARCLVERKAKCLLVIDDFQETPMTARFLASLLDRVQNLRILISSRTPFQRSSEMNVNIDNFGVTALHENDAALLFLRHLKKKVCISSRGASREADLDEIASHPFMRSLEGCPETIIQTAVRLSSLSNDCTFVDLDGVNQQTVSYL